MACTSAGRWHRSRRRFEVRVDTAFGEVVAACGDPARPGGWITPAMVAAYDRLHALGWAHSVEVWTADGQLAGGLFGIAIGGLFAAESKFHRETDASKVAVAALAELVAAAGDSSDRVIDVQWSSDHLASLGVVEISRTAYLRRLGTALALPSPFADRWTRRDAPVAALLHNGAMPELPEVESLVAFLRQHAIGRTVRRVDVAAINALSTYDPPVSALHGLTVLGAERHGKFLDLSIGPEPLHLVVHLARAGWLHWRDPMSSVPPKLGRSPIAIRVHLAGAPATDPDAEDRPVGFDLTEAGTQKKLSVALVRKPSDVPGVARLGIDPLDDAFTAERLGAILAKAGAKQLKGVLRDQATIAGIGNAYSDEALHAAKMSPFRAANKLDDGDVETLHAAIVGTLRDALVRAEGLAAGELKSEKKSNLRVHGRAGSTCPVCGDTVREVSLRRLVAPVLSDLPDRRETARRPPTLPALEVIGLEVIG